MRKTVVAVLLMSLSLLVAASALAASKPPAPKTWYVSVGTGNDKNSGTITKPFRTVAKAIASASKTTGDSIRIAAGDYPETLTMTGFGALTVQGGWDRSFKTFDPATYTTRLVGNGSETSVGFDIRNSFGVVLASLEITGYNQGVFTSNDNQDKVNVTVANCNLNANVTGIHFVNSSIDVKGNRISGSAYGVYSPPDPNTYYGSYDRIFLDISGNRIFNNSLAGLYLQGVAFDAARRQVHNNVLYGNATENIFIRGTRLDTMNNTIVGGVYGIHIETSSIFMTYGGIGNNIITNVTGTAIHAGWNVNLTTTNNLLYNNALDRAGNVGVQSPDLATDPLLDLATFRLTAGSPCIDSGVGSFYDPWGAFLTAPAVDIDGNPRAADLGGDGLYDIGADEFVQ